MHVVGADAGFLLIQVGDAVPVFAVHGGGFNGVGHGLGLGDNGMVLQALLELQAGAVQNDPQVARRYFEDSQMSSAG